MGPQDLEAGLPLEHIQGVTRAPTTSTYRCGDTSSIIDYFIVSRLLAYAMPGPTVLSDAPTGVHSIVEITLPLAQIDNIKVLVQCPYQMAPLPTKDFDHTQIEYDDCYGQAGDWVDEV